VTGVVQHSSMNAMYVLKVIPDILQMMIWTVQVSVLVSL